VATAIPDPVKRPVDHFDRDRRVFLSPGYKEEQLPLAKTPRAWADSSRPTADRMRKH
jgi:hypothetical protein